ncbi:hypothetical protein AMC87_CH02878 [Rhizobium phaseoli]|uniref:hypothetical protein n=1 Tax=Rhizobium phaseoli TaxID=396 RepID=UPI0007F10A69|nr:hypothetical protein [Rhizobium phaseoli]ANL47544.1 hypothetical protein AMC87_CH02878 [Rhizobium phaseoli]
MSIRIRFKKDQPGVSHYFVSINGFPEMECGPGNQGLAVAMGVLKYASIIESTQKAVEESLRNSEKLVKDQGLLLLEWCESKLEAKVFIDGVELKAKKIWDLANLMKGNTDDLGT